MTKRDTRPEPESIWLEPSCYDERCWSEDQLYDCEDCNTKSPQYIRADLIARHREQAERETVEKIARWLVNIVDMEDVDNEGWGACTIAYKLKQGEWKQ